MTNMSQSPPKLAFCAKHNNIIMPTHLSCFPPKIILLDETLTAMIFSVIIPLSFFLLWHKNTIENDNSINPIKVHVVPVCMQLRMLDMHTCNNI